MIQELRNTKPFIDFGLGITATTVKTGETVTVWLSTLYNADVYETALNPPGGTSTRISDYEHEVTYPSPGVYAITLTVSSTARKISLQSNTLTLTVI